MIVVRTVLWFIAFSLVIALCSHLTWIVGEHWGHRSVATILVSVMAGTPAGLLLGALFPYIIVGDFRYLTRLKQ